MKHPYRKGANFERKIKKTLKENGFKVVRSAGSHGKGDLYVEGLGTVQVKARKNLAIYTLFEGADVLVVKADYKEPLIVMPLEKFLLEVSRGRS
jgi:Holliday junction resolvase